MGGLVYIITEANLGLLGAISTLSELVYGPQEKHIL